MAALRLKLTFEYPPPALPQSRHVWFMLEAERCRAIADVSAIIRERFFYSRRGALSLHLDGCLLPPGESVRLIRDNDALSVKWEGSGPHDSLQREDGAEDSGGHSKTRAAHRGSPERKRGSEEEIGGGPRKRRKMVTAEEPRDCRGHRKKTTVVTHEEETACGGSKKKKKVTLEEEVNGGTKQKTTTTVTPEEEEDCRGHKKKMTVIPEQEVSGDSKKRRKKTMVIPEQEACGGPKKKKKTTVTPEEEPQNCRGHRKKTTTTVTPKQEDDCRGHRNMMTVTPEEEPQNCRGHRKKTTMVVTPEEEVNGGLKKKKVLTPEEEDEDCKGHRKKTTVIPEEEVHGGTKKTNLMPPEPKISEWPKKVSPELWAEAAGKSCPVAPPVCNGHVGTAGQGVGRGRPRVQGEAQPPNHFFYDASPEAVKERQLSEDISHVSVLIQNPPEVPRRDYSALPLLAAPPPPGGIIAFKELELTENYTPEVSDYKEARVLSYDPVSQQLEVEVLSQQKKKEPGKFDLVYEGEDGTEIVEYAVPQECKITQAWSLLIEPRLVTEHGSPQRAAPGP